jgi:hypothetical protein
MLATTGTAKLSAADETHPSYIIADAVLSEVIEEFSSRELWFNTTIRTLTPNTANYIVVPANALSCDPVDTRLDYAVRGLYLFDLSNYTFEIPDAVSCVIVAELALEDMPPIAIQFIRAHARLQYYVDQDGTGTKAQAYQQKALQKDSDLITINMKHTDANYFRGQAYASFSTRRPATHSTITRIQ